MRPHTACAVCCSPSLSPRDEAISALGEGERATLTQTTHKPLVPYVAHPHSLSPYPNLALGKWIVGYPAKLLDDKFLKYFGWLLHDKDPNVRSAVVTALLDIFQVGGKKWVFQGVYTSSADTITIHLTRNDLPSPALPSNLRPIRPSNHDPQTKPRLFVSLVVWH